MASSMAPEPIVGAMGGIRVATFSGVATCGRVRGSAGLNRCVIVSGASLQSDSAVLVAWTDPARPQHTNRRRGLSYSARDRCLSIRSCGGRRKHRRGLGEPVRRLGPRLSLPAAASSLRSAT